MNNNNKMGWWIKSQSEWGCTLRCLYSKHSHRLYFGLFYDWPFSSRGTVPLTSEEQERTATTQEKIKIRVFLFTELKSCFGSPKITFVVLLNASRHDPGDYWRNRSVHARQRAAKHPGSSWLQSSSCCSATTNAAGLKRRARCVSSHCGNEFSICGTVDTDGEESYNNGRKKQTSSDRHF